MRRQVSCPCKGTGETLVLHAFIFTLLHIRQKDKTLNRVAGSISKFNLLLISSCKQFLFVRVFPKYLKYAVFFIDLIVELILQFCLTFCWCGMKIYSILSAFISGLAASLATNTASVFFLTTFLFSKHQHRKNFPSLLETSSVIYKAKQKNGIGHLLFQTVLNGTPAGLIFNLILRQWSLVQSSSHLWLGLQGDSFPLHFATSLERTFWMK